MTSNARRELVEFVVDKAFQPVMRARPDGRPDAERKMLSHVQDATRAEIKRYRHYRSATDVVTNFKRDLTSRAAKKVHAQLRRLRLPTIEDIKSEFEAKTRKLDVR